MATTEEEQRHAPERRTAETALRVVMFEDMQASTALKRELTQKSDEAAFQRLRHEHDTLVRRIVGRDGAGEVIKWTGDGCIALFRTPSVAVERAMELQEELFHNHPKLKVRIGIDMGEVRIESIEGRPVDVFGAHVDWAARAMGLVDGGHIAVTAPVHGDAFSWITKSRIAWKRHGRYRAKPTDPPLEIYQPYNANHHRPMRQLRGEKVDDATAAPTKAAAKGARLKRDLAPEEEQRDLQLIRPWEAVARDGREFATSGAGTMYWFKVPLGGISYPEGFRHFLQPALENDRIQKIRFVLDGANEAIRNTWERLVLPLTEGWAHDAGLEHRVEDGPDGGTFLATGTTLGWVFVDLSTEFTPCFKLFVDDPDSEYVAESTAQIFLSTAQRMVRFADGSHHMIRIPDAVLRVRPGRHEALLHALNAVANQWDSLFASAP